MERHQTLRHAVEWSYDLLDDDERTVLHRCSVFAGGFDLAAATAMSATPLDEYAVLDVLDSLVRKSLVTRERVERHARYGMLETIRQFAEDQLAAQRQRGPGSSRAYFADQAVAHGDVGRAPPACRALDWVDRRVRQPARRVPLGRRPGRPGRRRRHRRPHHAVGFVVAALSSRSAGPRRSSPPPPPPTARLPRLYTAASLCGLHAAPGRRHRLRPNCAALGSPEHV